jgi:hypothetical protein
MHDKWHCSVFKRIGIMERLTATFLLRQSVPRLVAGRGHVTAFRFRDWCGIDLVVVSLSPSLCQF